MQKPVLSLVLFAEIRENTHYFKNLIGIALRDGNNTHTKLAPDFCSYSRRTNRRIVSYVTVCATQKMDRKTSQFRMCVIHVPNLTVSALFDFG